MKPIVTAARILTGTLFIFSGLVKAIDPRGLAYKMQEFFEAWANSGFLPGFMSSLDSYALTFSIVMITLEVVAGAALLLGWQKKITTWILFLLVVFFTFLTGYVLFTGKIRACGCFGDCIPLTPVQTFTKDIILLILSLILLTNKRHIHPLKKPWINGIYIFIITIATLGLQWYVLRHLPVIDCLPYKKGNNILKLREMPEGAVMDKYDYTFVYEKDGLKKEFTAAELPDSTWTFSDRKQVLVQKGKNNIPLINDFSLTDSTGTDVTSAVFNQPGTYYILFIKSAENDSKWADELRTFAASNPAVYVVTSQKGIVQNFLVSRAISFKEILTVDATALKTAARANPTMYKMKGPVVQEKWGWADFGKLR